MLPGLSLAPGEVYTTHFPGHTRPVFIRKRTQQRQPQRNFNLLAEAFGRPQRYYTTKRMRTSSVPLDESYVVDVPSQVETEQVRPDQPTMVTRTSGPGRVVVRDLGTPGPAFMELVQPTTTTYITRHPSQAAETTTRHTCASCGRFRSPSYQDRHRLAPGEIPKPNVCRKCKGKQTSSEESLDGHKGSRKKTDYYHLCRRWTASTGDRISEFERGRSRYLTNKRSKIRSARRSGSDEQLRVAMSYDDARSRTRTSEYSPKGRMVRVVRRIQYVDSHGRPLSRSRSSSKTGSRRHYRRSDSYGETSDSEDDSIRVRVRNIHSRSRSRSVTSKRPLRIVRRRSVSSFDDDYEHIYTSAEERAPRRVERVVEVEDDQASGRSRVSRQPESMIVEPGTTYAATQAEEFQLNPHYSEHPMEMRSYTERAERPPSRSVRIVKVSPEAQDAFCRDRISKTIESQRVIYEPRPAAIITRQVVEPVVQSVTETKIIEPTAAPVTETLITNRQEHSQFPVSETRIAERRGRFPAQVRERHVVEQRARSPSRVYERNVETRSRSRPAVFERDVTGMRSRSPSLVYERHTMESRGPSGQERRRRVKTRGRRRSTDSSDEYSPPGTLFSYTSVHPD